jgi:glycosyltransferase involved in cell wall biosynthesis
MTQIPPSKLAQQASGDDLSHSAMRVSILGIRGLPAEHGGFETFAERLAPYLVKQGWQVTVYCQGQGRTDITEDNWNGIRRVTIFVSGDGPASSMKFDWLCILHAAREKPVCLTLGYNTALFCFWLRIRGVSNLINMDGMEWKRAKWSKLARLWFWINDWAGCLLGDALIADHPMISDHLATRVDRKKITMIPYGADELFGLKPALPDKLGLVAGKYFTLIARAEPENSILEIVKGFSSKKRGVNLVVLGNYHEESAYHRSVKSTASAEVIFLGAIYDKAVVRALRANCLGYFHGHRVGGTNPSLVEALGAGNVIIAHDNAFNRWVSGASAYFFRDPSDVSNAIDDILANAEQASDRAAASLERFQKSFRWEPILNMYDQLLRKFLKADGREPNAVTNT